MWRRKRAAADKGWLQSFRFGQFAPGKSRMVFDTTLPVRIDARLRRSGSGAAGRTWLDIVLQPMTATEIAAAEIAAAAATAAVRPQALEREKPRPTRTKPVIVIDPGHGGIDPGTQGALGAREGYRAGSGARNSASAAPPCGDMRSSLTRTPDTFVSLEDRVRLSRQRSADLFMSIHADSLEAREIRAERAWRHRVHVVGSRFR